MVAGSEAPREATLREIFGELTPVAVIHGDNSPTPGEIDVCPTRDQQVHAGDRAVMIGTADESAQRGIRTRRPVGTRSRRARLRRILDAVRTVVNDFNPAFYPALAAALTLIVISMLLLRFNYRHPRMSWVDALYFTIETITTTGYGDFSFAHQETWLRLFSAGLMFGGATTIALLVAFIADVLLSRRFVFAAARPRVRHLRNHVIVVGLSALGMRVVTELVAAGYDVAVIEINENNRFLSAAQELDVPVIFGDATLVQTLQSARVDRARAVAVLTRDDMINIEAAIVLAELLGPRVVPKINRRAEVSLVLRVYDRALGLAVAQRFGFENVRSTVALAAPVVRRGRDGPGGAWHVLDPAELLHDRCDVRRPGQRARRAAISRRGEQHPSHCGHPTGRRDPAASSPRRAAGCRRHRLPRRPAPGAAGHAAPGAPAQGSRGRRTADRRPRGCQPPGKDRIAGPKNHARRTTCL